MQERELDALIERIADTSAHIDAATHMLLTDIRLLDESGGWFRRGAKSCAVFLSWRIGLGPGAARERMRVARALGALPLVDDALAHGLVSYSKVRALTRVATPENEEDLLMIARSSTAAQLEKICRMYAQVRSMADTEARARDLEDRRWVSSRPTGDGMVRISIQLRPEEAATVMKAIDASAGAGSKADRLMALAENALSGGRAEGAGTVKPPVEVMLHVDAVSLEGHAHDTGDGVSAETSRRLLCDCGVVPVLEARGETVDVGRKKRVIPPAIRRALLARDGGGCSFPGCENRRFVDAHHIEHWVDGGETKLGNLVNLCRMHHRYVHEYNYSIGLGEDGTPVVCNPAGEIIPPTGERSWLERPIGALRKRIASAGVAIDPRASIPDWDGTAPQYEWIVDCLSFEERMGCIAAARDTSGLARA